VTCWAGTRACGSGPRLKGFELDAHPDDLALPDEAIDRVIAQHGRHTRMSAVEGEAGLFLGTVIVSTSAERTGGYGPTGTRSCTWHSVVTWTWSPWPMVGWTPGSPGSPTFTPMQRHTDRADQTGRFAAE